MKMRSVVIIMSIGIMPRLFASTCLFGSFICFFSCIICVSPTYRTGYATIYVCFIIRFSILYSSIDNANYYHDP